MRLAVRKTEMSIGDAGQSVSADTNIRLICRSYCCNLKTSVRIERYSPEHHLALPSEGYGGFMDCVFAILWFRSCASSDTIGQNVQLPAVY